MIYDGRGETPMEKESDGVTKCDTLNITRIERKIPLYLIQIKMSLSEKYKQFCTGILQLYL